MMINTTYNAFAQNLLSNRTSADKFSSNMDNPLLLSTPDALTFEMVSFLDSNSSGTLSQSEARLDNTDFAQVDQNQDNEISFTELAASLEAARNTYVELLFINSRYSAFNTLTENGFQEMVAVDSEGTTFMEKAFQTLELSDFQKVAAHKNNLLYHTLLNPVRPSAAEDEFPAPSSELYEIISPLQNLDMQGAAS